MAFPLSNKAEIEEGQEENDMDDGAQAADLGRLDKDSCPRAAPKREPCRGRKESPRSRRRRLQGTCARLAMEFSRTC